MPPRSKSTATPAGPPPEPRKTTRQAAKLAVARIAASVQELDTIQDEEILAPPVKRRAGNDDEEHGRSKRSRTTAAATAPPKAAPAYPQQPPPSRQVPPGGLPPMVPGQYARMPGDRGPAMSHASAGIRLPPPPITQLQGGQPGGPVRSPFTAHPHHAQNGHPQYPGQYADAPSLTPSGMPAAYPQSHGGSSGQNTIQVNTHVSIYPNHLQGDRNMSPQALLDSSQRADYFNHYDARPPPYSQPASTRVDPNQVRLLSPQDNFEVAPPPAQTSRPPQHMRPEYSQQQQQQQYYEGQRRVDPQPAGGPGYQYFDVGASEAWSPPGQPSLPASRSQSRAYQDFPVDQPSGAAAYSHQLRGYPGASVPQGLTNDAQIMRRDSRGYSQLDQQYPMPNGQPQMMRRDSHNMMPQLQGLPNSQRRESQSFMQQSGGQYPPNAQLMRRESQTFSPTEQYGNAQQYPQMMSNSVAGGSRAQPASQEYNNAPHHMGYPNQAYSRANSISSASNIQSTPSPMSNYDVARPSSAYSHTPTIPSQAGPLTPSIPLTPSVPSSFEPQSCYPFDHQEGENLDAVYDSMSEGMASRLNAIEDGLANLSNGQKREVFMCPAFRDYNGAQKGGNIVLDEVRDYCLRKVAKQRTDLREELKAVESVGQVHSADGDYQ